MNSHSAFSSAGITTGDTAEENHAVNKRILFVSDTGAFRGGVERFIFQAQHSLPPKGFIVPAHSGCAGEDSERFLAPFESYSFDPDDFAEMAEMPI